MFITVVALLICAAAYLAYFAKGALSVFAPKLKKPIAYVISIVFAALIVALGIIFMTSPILIVALYLILVGIACDIVRAVLHFALKKHETAAKTAKETLRCGLIPLVGSLLIVTLGFFNMNTVHRTEYDLTTEKNISDYKIAFVSDLHFGVSMDLNKLHEYCSAISSEQPDIVLLGGDIVDESTPKDDVEPVFTALGGINSKYGVYFVYGNHDRSNYARVRSFSDEELESIITGSGITVLDGRSQKVSEDIVVAGREDIGISHSNPNASGEPRVPTAELLSGYSDDDYKIVLDHQPIEFSENIGAGTDLQLSGHTHNGQIWPFGWLIGPISGNVLEYGIKNIDGFTAITSSGIAGWGYNIRTEGICEYVIVNLSHK